MSKLIGYVTVHDEDGSPFTFAPGDDVPDWAAAKISNPNVWAEGKSETKPVVVEQVDPADDKPVPFSQMNKEALEKVASDEGVDISGASTNKEIRDAITAHRDSK